MTLVITKKPNSSTTSGTTTTFSALISRGHQLTTFCRTTTWSPSTSISFSKSIAAKTVLRTSILATTMKKLTFLLEMSQLKAGPFRVIWTSPATASNLYSRKCKFSSRVCYLIPSYQPRQSSYQKPNIDQKTQF